MDKLKLGALTGIFFVLGALIATGLAGVELPAWNPLAPSRLPDELVPGQYVTIYDRQGKVLTKISRSVVPGDEIITADGRHYRITRVQELTARARFLGKDEKLLAWREFFSQSALPVAATRSGDVAVYHTHSDESYVPSDGSASIPYNGGIFDVGERFARALEKQRVRVFHSRTPHDPHDAQAYVRSRRTAAQLLKSNPAAIFDVHRDGVPDPEFYREYIQGERLSQLRLVIGRQNPHMQANLEFARKLMAQANKSYPGLVKEIFMGAGDYNQDLAPQSLLIEAGTYTLYKEEAQDGIELLASVVPAVMGVGAQARPRIPETRTPGAWSALLWIIVITLGGVAAFLVLSAGGLDKARQRLKTFVAKELDFLRTLRKPGDDNR